MYAAILVLTMIGQCSGGSCFSGGSSFSGGFNMMPDMPAFQAPIYLPAPAQTFNVVPAPATKPKDTLQRIKMGASIIEVWGYKKADGLVSWDANDERNQKLIADAVAESNKPATLPLVRPTGDLTPNYGMEPSRIGRKSEYTAPSIEAKRFVAEAKAKGEPEVAARLHVTVVGNQDERARVVNDLNTHAAFAGVKPFLFVQDYDPKEWPVDPALGFKAGKPAIVVQLAKGDNNPKGGRIVYRADDYSMGPEKLAEAIRKADPNYKPELDPGPSNPGVGLDSESTPIYISAAVVGLIIFLLPPKKD